MASSGRPTYHQDYIARIRYSNALPPPPCPPKLLEIPNTGLSSGQYTDPAFASRLAREQIPNIEADAELGMPIDLVGIKGVFNGDESLIQASDVPTQLDPRDRALLRPLAALGKPASSTSGVSFLRRTEYITSVGTGGSRFESSNSGNTMRVRGKRRRGDISQDDPINIVRHVTKGFDIAYPQDAYTGPDTDTQIRAAEISPEEKKAWNRPMHPTRELKLEDAYPILPDLDALPDTGSYTMYKFLVPPIKHSNDRYDERMDVAILRPIGSTHEHMEHFQQELAAFEADPSGKTMPSQQFQFEFFLPPSSDKVGSMKRNFSAYAADNEDDIDFDGDFEGHPCFRYDNIRIYETAQQSGDPQDAWGDTVAMALHDADEPAKRDGKLQKAAYIYPIQHRTGIRPKRKLEKHTPMVSLSGEEGEEPRVDIIEARGREPEGESEPRSRERARYDVDVGA